MESKVLKRTLIGSLVTIALCITMLIGTTFAWFTDTSVSENNVIKSGTLDVKMYWSDNLKGEDTVWNDIEDEKTPPIFNYDKWEPGYAQVRYIKIENNGSVAFKYLLNIIPNAQETELAEVLDLYYAENIAENVTLPSMEGLTKTDKTLKEFVRDDIVIGDGYLKAGEDIILGIGIKMRESAGNEYQNLTFGKDFTVRLMATQQTFEEDSFSDQYDKDATFPRPYYEINTDEVITIDENGKYIVFHDEEGNYLDSQNGEKITLSNAIYSGETLAFYLGYYRDNKYNKFNTVLNNVKVLNLKVTNGVRNRYDYISPAVYGYGKTEFNNCIMKGTTNTADSYVPYDLGIPNRSECTINGGEYGSIYLWSQAKITINCAKVDRIDSAAIKTNGLGKLVIGEGTTVGVINFTDPEYEPTLTIKAGATVGKITYKGVEYTVEEWNNR